MDIQGAAHAKCLFGVHLQGSGFPDSHSVLLTSLRAITSTALVGKPDQGRGRPDLELKPRGIVLLTFYDLDYQRPEKTY